MATYICAASSARFQVKQLAAQTKRAKQLLTITYDGVGETKTDIDGEKKFFRERSVVKKFFKVKSFKDGDEVLITRVGPYEFEVKKA